MIPYELDPSLHHAEPASPLLDDGFSPRPARSGSDDSGTAPAGAECDPQLRPEPVA